MDVTLASMVFRRGLIEQVFTLKHQKCANAAQQSRSYQVTFHVEVCVNFLLVIWLLWCPNMR